MNVSRVPVWVPLSTPYLLPAGVPFSLPPSAITLSATKRSAFQVVLPVASSHLLIRAFALSLAHPPHPLLDTSCAFTVAVFLLLHQTRCLPEVYQRFPFLRTSIMTENESSYNFGCPVDDCSRWFKNLTGLTQHIQAKHPNKDADINMGTFPD